MSTGNNTLLKNRNQILETDTQCTHCGEKMVESMVDRVCNQYKKVQIHSFDQNGIFSNSLIVKLSNNMINIGQVGDQIEVIGYVVGSGSDNQKKQNYVHCYESNIIANNVRKIHYVNGVFDLQKNSDLFGLSDARLPLNVTKILESEMSPYLTGQNILDLFLHDIISPKMFRKMKLSLLMR